MKVFISWSGTRSHNAAKALKEWLPDLFNGIETFVSSEDIRRGKRWPIEVSKELESSSLGIVCLTNDNLEAPWVLFESGALSKSLKDSSLFTLLLGTLKPSDIDGPLSHFQHTIFEKENFYGLVKTIEEAREASLRRDEPRLRKTFNLHWPELEENIKKAMLSAPAPRPERKPEDIWREILDVVTSIAKNMPQTANLLESLKQQLYAESTDPTEQFIRASLEKDKAKYRLGHNKLLSWVRFMSLLQALDSEAATKLEIEKLEGEFYEPDRTLFIANLKTELLKEIAPALRRTLKAMDLRDWHIITSGGASIDATSF